MEVQVRQPYRGNGLVEFFIPGACVPKGRPRMRVFKSGKVVTYTPPRTRNYAELARAVAYNAMQEAKAELIPFPKPVRMTIEFLQHFSQEAGASRPDIINLASQICDTLNGIVYTDDSQVVDLHLKKVPSEYPMVRILVEPVV